MNNNSLKDKLNKAYDELRYRHKVKNRTDFGLQLGYTRTYFSQLLNGGEPVTDKVIATIEQKFGIESSWFYSEGSIPVVFADSVGNELDEPYRKATIIRKEEWDALKKHINYSKYKQKVDEEPISDLLIQLFIRVEELEKNKK